MVFTDKQSLTHQEPVTNKQPFTDKRPVTDKQAVTDKQTVTDKQPVTHKRTRVSSHSSATLMTNVLARTAQHVPIYHLQHCANVCIVADSGTVQHEYRPEH